MSFNIAQPPWTGLGTKIEKGVRKALFDFNMLDGISKIAVALSGGKDSFTLLFMLKAISGRGFPQLDITAIMVHGAFSCGAGVNRDYLQKTCDALDINFISVDSPITEIENLECYPCSRIRRRLLFDTAKSHGIDTIAFGHHQDDSAQTVLMNMLQKGEFAGNLPKIKMHEYGITIIRPLIYICENDIRNFAEQYKFIRVMCRCPVGQNSMRKKVADLLTNIEELFPNARKNIAMAGLNYGSDKASIDPKIRKNLEPIIKIFNQVEEEIIEETP